MKKYDKTEIYNDKFDTNVDEILKKIEEIKATIAGREESFLPFIITNGEVDIERLNILIYEFLGYIEERDTECDLVFGNEKKEFFYDFIYCTIIYCIIACNENDSIFESVLKLATTTKKESAQEESTFDILISDLSNDYPKEYAMYSIHEHYTKFNEKFESFYEKDYFISDIRHAINTFLELRKISKYTIEDNREILRILNFAKLRLKALQE